MKDIRTEKTIYIAMIMNKFKYEINETVIRRINNYNFKTATIITHNERYIKISTETKIKGVYNVLILYPTGLSKLAFEFSQ